jgi:hypothetical protein
LFGTISEQRKITFTPASEIQSYIHGSDPWMIITEPGQKTRHVLLRDFKKEVPRNVYDAMERAMPVLTVPNVNHAEKQRDHYRHLCAIRNRTPSVLSELSPGAFQEMTERAVRLYHVADKLLNTRYYV